MDGDAGSVDLGVDLPSFLEGDYLDDDSDDDSYVPSDDGDASIDESEEDGGVSAEKKDESGSGIEKSEKEDTSESSAIETEGGNVSSDEWETEDGDEPSDQSEMEQGDTLEYDPRPSFQAEGHLYTTLHRLLDTCAHSLEIFTLIWKPLAASRAGAAFILPESLPKLKSFAVWQESIQLYELSGNSWEDRIAQEVKDKGMSLPSLQRLETNVPIVGNWPEQLPLESIQLRYATAPCTSVKYVNILFLSHLIFEG